MAKLKELIEDNKLASLLALLTFIAFIVGLIICFSSNAGNKTREKKVLEEYTYTMYLKEKALVKIVFKESFYTCNKTICSDYTDKVSSFDYVNDEAKNLYGNINIKNKDLDEAISMLLTEVKNKNYNIESLQLISNWKSRYTSDEFKELLAQHMESTPTLPIIFEYRETVDEQSIMESPTIKTYTVAFDSNSGSPVEAQIVNENALATEPQIPTRDGYDFVRWQYNSRPFSFNTPITQDYTLKASWKKKPTVSTVQTTKKTTKAPQNNNTPPVENNGNNNSNDNEEKPDNNNDNNNNNQGENKPSEGTDNKPTDDTQKPEQDTTTE